MLTKEKGKIRRKERRPAMKKSRRKAQQQGRPCACVFEERERDKKDTVEDSGWRTETDKTTERKAKKETKKQVEGTK